MNHKISVVVLLTFLFLSNACSVTKKNPAVATDAVRAQVEIKQIQEKGLVVIFPTSYKKEAKLQQHVEAIPSLEEDLQKLRYERAIRLKIWQIQKGAYDFSKLYIVPDSLLMQYIKNPNEAFYIGENGELEQGQLGENYALYTDFGGFEVKQNGKFLPYPFPNKGSASKGSSIRKFLGVQTEDQSVYWFFSKLDIRFKNYYLELEE